MNPLDDFRVTRALLATTWPRNQCVEHHRNTNHKYGTFDYAVHLWMVQDYAKSILQMSNIQVHLTDQAMQDILVACCAHDLIEDCRLTYNDVKEQFGKTVADITYALTNEKGKTRAERANEKYYKEMVKVPFAVFVKLCDRAANVTFAIRESKSDMWMKYINEYAKFKELLYNEQSPQFFLHKPMWDILDNLH